MSVVMTVKIEGGAEVERALRNMLPDRTARAVMTRILKKRAEPIAARARTLVPVRTGALKRSIGVSKQLTRRQKMLFRWPDKNDVILHVGAGGYPHAHLQEFGTQNMPAQPYMRPAWDAARVDILKKIADDLWMEIEKSVKRAARKAAKAGG